MAGRTVFVVLVAVGLGLLVLRNAYDDGGTASAGGTTTTTVADGASTTAATSTTTTVVLDKKSFQTVVANGSGVAGSAGKWTNGLVSLGFDVLPATNAVQSGQPTTTVYFLPGFDAAAALVASSMGATSVVAWPSDAPPVKTIGEADVVVVLGQDLASKTPPAPTG